MKSVLVALAAMGLFAFPANAAPGVPGDHVFIDPVLCATNPAFNSAHAGACKGMDIEFCCSNGGAAPVATDPQA